MDWSLVMEFIRQRDPGFAAALEGVPAADIAALAASCGTMLPGSYVEFLRLMGLNSNGYFPFGGSRDHSFAAVVERLDDHEEDHPPANSFFPVAIETDESMVDMYDLYLDLRRGDADDAPIVMLDVGVPFNVQSRIETNETFGERITSGVFNHFQLGRCAEHEVVAMGGTLQPGEGQAALRQALSLLQRAGFAPVLPPSGRLACLQRGPLSVRAKVNDEYELLTLRVGSDDRVAVTELFHQLLANLPGARRPAGPRNLD